MISIRYDASDPYRAYGVDHFISKYGITIKENNNTSVVCKYYESMNGQEVVIKVLKNDIENDICGYLEIKDMKIPIFEKPVRLNTGNPLVMFRSEGNEYPCATFKNNTLTIGFDVFNEVGHILSGHLEHFWKSCTPESQKIAKIPVVDFYEKILFDCMLFACEQLNLSIAYKPLWPDGKKFALCLTHDVDRVNKTYQYFTHFLDI